MDKSTSQNQNPATNPEQWVDLYGDYLFRFALGRLRNTQLAENMVQETFLAALGSRKKFSGRSLERTWMIGILKHKIIDHLRQKYRESPVTDLTSEDISIDQFFDQSEHLKKEPGNWHPDQRKILENKEFWKQLEECVSKLPAKVADVFTLREIDQLPGKKICQDLQISPTNLWVMLHRARMQLRQCLETNWFEQ